MPNQFNRNDSDRKPGGRGKPAPSWQKDYVASQEKVKAELASQMLTIRTIAKKLGVTTAQVKSAAKKQKIVKADWDTAEFDPFEYGLIKEIIIAKNNANVTVTRTRF